MVNKMSDLILWIKRREPAIVIPVLDKFIILLSKLFYLASYIFLRLSFRLILGKQRRNDLLKNF